MKSKFNMSLYRGMILPKEMVQIIGRRIEFLKNIDEKLGKIDMESNQMLEAISRRNSTEYYIVSKEKSQDGQEKREKRYVRKKDRDKAVALAQRDYDRNVRKAIANELELLSEIVKCWLPCEDLYENLPAARKNLVIPVIDPVDDFVKKWDEVEYMGLGFEKSDDSEFYTARGERVRSKSEIMIADALFRRNIPYRYECPIVIKGKKYFPDFMVLNKRTREVYIWEHLGMMGNIEYIDNNLIKLRKYEEAGYINGKNLIITMENLNCPISTKAINKKIDAYLV